MCVFKYHAFIYFLRPPPWYGTCMCTYIYTYLYGYSTWTYTDTYIFITFHKSCSAVWRFSWQRKLSRDCLYVSRWLSISCPSPHLSADMRGELYFLSPEEKFLSTQCCCRSFCDALVLTSSSSSSATTTTSLFFVIPCGRVSCLFLGCHYACFK